MHPKSLTLLAAMYALHPEELRADLQRVYGIDLDHAMRGEHTAAHVAALAVNLSRDACVFATESEDARWGLAEILLADIRNTLVGFVWGMSDRRKRGRKPVPIGPSWMTRGKTRTLDARVLTIEQLQAELAKPRR